MGAASGGDKGDLHRKRLPLRLLVAESGDDADRETIHRRRADPWFCGGSRSRHLDRALDES
jgi:hypothetical protein